MQESRLFRIVYYLLEKGHAIACELAEEFEVSTRTIYRDINLLNRVGIPVYAEPGRHGGIYMMNDSLWDRDLLSEKERQDVITAMRNIDAILYSRNDTILNQLSALFHISLGSWLEIDCSRWGDRKAENKKFDSLKSAVLSRKRVKIRYVSSRETAGEQVVEPMKLMYQAGGWYLRAFCRKNQDYHLFKLARILEYTVLKEVFVPQAFAAEQNALQREYDLITLRFPQEMACRVYDEFDTAQVERQENGDFLVSAQLPEDDRLIGFLLSFGAGLEIVEPVYLRERVAEQARLIYEKNNRKRRPTNVI